MVIGCGCPGSAAPVTRKIHGEPIANLYEKGTTLYVSVKNTLSFSASHPDGVPLEPKKEPDKHCCESRGELEIMANRRGGGPGLADSIALTAHGDHGSGNGKYYSDTAVVVLTLDEFQKIVREVYRRGMKVIDENAAKEVQTLLEDASARLTSLLSDPCGNSPKARTAAKVMPKS
jgi:hypothetical protein